MNLTIELIQSPQNPFLIVITSVDFSYWMRENMRNSYDDLKEKGKLLLKQLV